jgi:hypothetical protein
MRPRLWRAVRAATLMRSRRRVAALALAQVRLARDPAARSSERAGGSLSHDGGHA